MHDIVRNPYNNLEKQNRGSLKEDIYGAKEKEYGVQIISNK